MTVKIKNFSLWGFIIIASILMAILMESSISVYLEEIYNPKYYIYQALLYSLAVFVIIVSKKRIHERCFVGVMWAFSLCCFFFSVIQLNAFNARNVISLFFNTFIIPISFLNGLWLGNRLFAVKDRDLFLLLIQIPALYSMILLRSYIEQVSWFHADAAFCIIVFMPFIFFFKRSWLTSLFAFIYILIALTSAKRSILIYAFFCIFLFVLYVLNNRDNSKKSIVPKRVLLALIAIMGTYFIINQKSDVLFHARERAEELGGMVGDNGRYDIYSMIIHNLSLSDSFHLLFGHGQMALVRDIGVGAHNDLLEITYDYGFLSVILYLVILIRFFVMAIRAFRHRQYQLSLRVGISISSIAFLGFLNCIVTSTVLEYSMFLALGCAIGLKDDNSDNK